MVRSVSIALAVASLLGVSLAVRKGRRAGVNTTQQRYTTTKGCTCKSSSQCDADVGTGYKCDTCKTEGSCGTWSVLGRWDYCDYRPSTRSGFHSQSWESKMDYFWKNFVADRRHLGEYPLLSNFLSSVRTTFDNFAPEMPAGRQKMIHSIGSVCKFDLAISGKSPYTGVLAPGVQRGIVRLGSAVAPGTAGSGVTPGLGIKFPRSGVPDGGVVMLYSLAFGDSYNFFALNQSNHLKPGVGFPQNILAAKFCEASDCIYQVGLSDLAKYSQDGRQHTPVFPFKIFMVANPSLKTGQSGEDIDGVHADIDAIPVGTTLYTVYACQEPAGDELSNPDNLESNCGSPLLLGEMKTSSECTTSRYGDASFHIKHQRIEEDWQADPSLMRTRGAFNPAKACDRSSIDSNPPPTCGLEGMLMSDA